MSDTHTDSNAGQGNTQGRSEVTIYDCFGFFSDREGKQIRDMGSTPLRSCYLCAAVVIADRTFRGEYPQLDKHAAWHNRIVEVAGDEG